MPPKEKSKELKHRNIICLKLTDIELEILNQAASSVGISRSEYLRRLFLNKPIQIEGTEHADKVFMGEIGQDFLKRLDKVELKGLGIWESGFRNLTNSKKEINSAEDVKGLRIRVMENEIHQCISDLFLLRKKVLEMAGDFHGDTKAHQK